LGALEIIYREAVYVQPVIWSDGPIISTGYNLGHMGVTPAGVITCNLLQVQVPPHPSYF